MKLFILGLYFLLNTTGFGLETRPLRSIPVKIAFETKIESPNHLSHCGPYVWTYSEQQQSLVGINTENGNIEKKVSLQKALKKTEPIDVAALSCQSDRLLVLINEKNVAQILEFHVEKNQLNLIKRYDPPHKERATDLFCNLNQCWILQDKPMITYNFKKWYEIWAPFPPELKKVYNHLDQNPFEDWQSTLVLAKGKYTKGAIDNYNQYMLLDPFHSQAIVRSGAEWVKWGSFGVWEGSFLAPKAVTFIIENILAVADAKLKAVFIYRRDGQYLGVLSLSPEKILAPDYPLGLTAVGGRLFIADFRAHKIIAADISNLTANFESIGPISVRQNLFRRDEVLKDAQSSLCLNCHDGTVSNQLHKFVSNEKHHPLECSQCHDPHHEKRSKHYLRLQSPELCQSCHKEYAQQKTNHVWNKNGKHGGSCNDCHSAHTNTVKLLNLPAPQLCSSCHKDKSTQHKSVEDLHELAQAKKISTHEGKISCTTCHQTHINWQETHFIRNPLEIMPFCAACHGNKSPQLFKDFHKIIKKGKEPK